MSPDTVNMWETLYCPNCGKKMIEVNIMRYEGTDALDDRKDALGGEKFYKEVEKIPLYPYFRRKWN